MPPQILLAEGVQRDFAAATGPMIGPLYWLAVNLEKRDNVLTDENLHESLA